MNTLSHKHNTQGRIFGLDLIRAVAIGLVLLSHFAKTVDVFGFIGVEIFFGLSGYLIGNILWRSFSTSWDWSVDNILNFWSRRWWRTLPSYYLFLLIFTLIATITPEPLPPLDELTKFIWFGQSFTKHYSWFYGVSWSLCIEEWFYLSFPTLLFIISLVNKNKRTTYALAILFVFLFSFATKWALYNEGVADDLRLLTVARLDAIASGLLIAYLEKVISAAVVYKKIFPLTGALLLVGLLSTIVINSMSVKAIESSPYLLTLFPLAFSLLLPFFNSIQKPHKLNAVVASWIEKVSLWSYSIYLSHMAVLSIIYFLQDTFLDFDIRATTLGNIATKSTGLVIILLVSSFLYKHVELPFMKKRPSELDYTKNQVNFS